MAKKLIVVLGNDITPEQVEKLSAAICAILEVAGLNVPTFYEEEAEADNEPTP
jgi:hypothetical protein